MDTKQQTIFQPVTLKGHQLKNRLTVAPMSRVSATAEGLPTAEMTDYYNAFAKGGFGMIITEGIYTDNIASKSYVNQPGITSAAHIAAWQQLTAEVKNTDVLLIAQLMHGGAISQYSAHTVAPSAIQPPGVKMVQYGGEGAFPMPRAMNTEDIQLAKQGFIDAAVAAMLAGFDGVELHAANGYLLDQFLTPECNTRQDAYGGSVANRFRLIAEIIDGIRTVVPAQFLVGIRLSEGKVNDMGYRWKNGLETAHAVLQEVKKASPDFIHIAVQSGEWERDSFYEDGSSYAALARQITGRQVIANGGMHQLPLAARVLEEGHADLLAIGKAALADPYWPHHMQQGTAPQPFHRDMLWPQATISHSRKIIQTLQPN
ncbi:NADH:flavin oxidoreductase [Chitinophaga sp. Mgbs1]|uniref:NADH:flavin oxidoreductase n=1 Tax=Chitinophaga solisilvae TaxID=1233460 RepID=A0A3S1BNY7_9BACT|nr:NADH:flavin oxidoreductase [Chitinophaga solisilvae]